MGWKNVKEHYRIGHSVHVTEKGICIGSSYIPDIIIIAPDGTIERVEPWRVKSGEKRHLTRKSLPPDPIPPDPCLTPLTKLAVYLFPYTKHRYPGRLAAIAHWLGVPWTTLQNWTHKSDRGHPRYPADAARQAAQRLRDHANVALSIASELDAYADHRDATALPNGLTRVNLHGRRNRKLRPKLTG